MNKSTSMSALPPTLLRDLRYISLRPSIRDSLIEAYIATQPPAPADSVASPEEAVKKAKQRFERQRREKALADRERKVHEEKWKLTKDLRYSRGLLREGEEEVQRAMRVGRDGLLAHLDGAED